MNAWGTPSHKIPTLLDSLFGASCDSFLSIVCNRRKYLVHLPADISTASITETKQLLVVRNR